MKTKIFLALSLGALLISCNKRHYYQADVVNPEYIPNTVFISSEDLTSPKFQHLIIKYQLDTVFHGETDDLKRILLLRHWIKSV